MVLAPVDDAMSTNMLTYRRGAAPRGADQRRVLTRLVIADGGYRQLVEPMDVWA
jgi:hypothetical protein